MSGDDDYIESWARRVVTKELKSENAKLRQLVRVMYCHYNRRSRGCDDCLMHNDGIRIEISDIEFCEEMYELMQECGIEVE